MTEPALRPYQLRAIDRLREEVRRGCRRMLVVAPTGSGKTIVAAELTRAAVQRASRVLFLAPFRELIGQMSGKLDAFDVPHSILLAGDRRQNLFSPVQVASWDTLRARASRLVFPDPHIVVVDEAHTAVTPARVQQLEQWPNAVRVGLTATPCRRDGRGLGALFDTLVQVATTAELTDAKYLVPARYFTIAEPDLERVAVRAGDFAEEQLAAAMVPLVADIPTTWLARAAKRRTVVFAVNVAHSVALAHAFLQHGVAAEHVDGGTPIEEREAIFARFTRGETQVLCNCNLASTGFDLPALDCVVLARPTKSLALYLQMIGRGLRPADSKADCLVLDHSGNVHRHGFATDPREWTLDGAASVRSSGRGARARITESHGLTCPQCSCTFSGGRLCPECGWYAAPRARDVRTLDGSLVEIGQHPAIATAERFAFYAELRGYAAERGYRPGWAAAQFRDRHGAWPPFDWNDAPAAPPTLSTRRWITSRQIAWRKAREAAARSGSTSQPIEEHVS